MGHSGTTMRVMAIAFNLLLLSHQIVAEDRVQYVTGEKGTNITLQCNTTTVKASTVLYQWRKQAVVIASQSPSKPSDHFSILKNGSLQICGLQYIDAGLYDCQSQTEGDSTWETHSAVQLQVAGGPASIQLDIKPATALKNGTLFVRKGSDVFFNCSSESVPSQNLTWMFEVSPSVEAVDKGFGIESSLKFSISNIQPSDQGIYTCISQNTLSMRSVKDKRELLVYYAPERHPECSWDLRGGPSDVLFICSWFGGYPAPTLEWYEVFKQSVILKGPTPQEMERLEVHVNRFNSRDGVEVICVGKHVTGVQKNCSFTLNIPYPLGDPLVTALEGTSVTLSCTETSSLPVATTVWKTKDNIVINSTSKYIVSVNKPTYTLTIVNVTKDDEGIFYCYSENPVGARELEVYLTVKSSAGNGGAVVGVFVSVLIVMIGIVVGVTAYSKRDRICIGLQFSSLSEDRGDVLSLVDSDEEEIFQDAVPRLPPITNGHTTTLVEIHRTPSNEQDDTADISEYADQNHPDPTESEH